MEQDLKKHQKNDKMKWIATAIVFVLVFIMVAGLCLQLFGQGKVKPSEWFKKPDTEQTQPVEGEESETAQTGISMLSATVLSDNMENENAPVALDDPIPLADSNQYPEYEVSGYIFFMVDGSRVGLGEIYLHCWYAGDNEWRYRLGINETSSCGVGENTVCYILHFPTGETLDITDLNDYDGTGNGYRHKKDPAPVAYFGRGLGSYVPCPPLTSSGNIEHMTEGFYIDCRSSSGSSGGNIDFVGDNSGFVTWVDPHDFVSYVYTGSIFFKSLSERVGLGQFHLECINRNNEYWGYRFSVNVNSVCAVGSRMVGSYIVHFPNGNTWDITDFNEFPSRRKGYTHKLDSVPVAYFGNDDLMNTYISLPLSGSGSSVSFGDDTDGFYIECVPVPVELPADPVKEGHTFVGWYYDSAYTRPYDGAPIYSDTSLYAKFEINKFGVTFNSDGGSSVASQTVNWNTAATLTTPTRDGYAFKGWFLLNGTQYTNQAIKEHTTLTAQWERNRFTVTFNSVGGSEVENQQVGLNETVILSTPTRKGYKFLGWFLADGTQYTNQPVTDDIILTAHWEVQTFTVTFYVDNEVYATKTVEYGQSLKAVATVANLSVMSVHMESGEPSYDDKGAMIVTANCSVEAQEMSETDKVINTVKENKWAIIGGVAGGVTLIAVIAAICGGAKRKRKR